MNLFLCRFCIDLWIVISKFNTAVMGISVLIIGNFSLLFSHHNKISTPKVSLGFLWCLLVKRITIRPTQISFLAAQPGNGGNVSSSLVPFILAKIIFNLLFLTETLDWLSCCLWSYIISCWSFWLSSKESCGNLLQIGLHLQMEAVLSLNEFLLFFSSCEAEYKVLYWYISCEPSMPVVRQLDMFNLLSGQVSKFHFESNED